MPPARLVGQRYAPGAHTNTICDQCMEDFVVSAIRSGRNVSCVDCRVQLDNDEVMYLAKQQGDMEAVKMLDARLLTSQLKDMPDFCWCAHGCGMGQEHPERGTEPMQCRKCHKKTCFRHKCGWHDGKTCDEHDAMQQRAEREAILKTGIKQCPKCGEGISKMAGCARMTCACKHTFCWDCGADYDGSKGIREVGNDAHASTCPWALAEPSCAGSCS